MIKIPEGRLRLFSGSRSRLFTLALFGGLLGSLPGAQAADCERLDVPDVNFPSLGLGIGETTAARAFYAQGPQGCVWSPQNRALLLATIEKTPDEGLSPKLFHIGLLRSLPTDGAEADFALTAVALNYGSVMTKGQVDLNRIESDVDLPRPAIDLTLPLKQALKGNRLEPWLAGLSPTDPEYVRLKAGLARYRDIASRGGWPIIPAGATLKLGDPAPELPIIQTRLIAEGDYAEPRSAASDVARYDETTVAAIKRFQQRHGLAVDGHLGPRTRAALAIPVQTRIEQIDLNLARWRVVGHLVPDTRVEVNAAAANATLIRNGEPEMTMSAVVGSKTTPTPMLISQISSLVINPPWNVPASITQREMLPKIAADPSYLAKNDMYWTNGRLVQRAGPKSSLGLIKFDFPNQFQVYLHDTPSRGAFGAADRARSHGCVRLGDPINLAAKLLAPDPAWSKASLDALVDSRNTRHVQLIEPMPVFLAYWTAFMDEDGTMEFRDDIYGRDQRLGVALYGSGNASQKSASLGTEVCRAC